MRWLMKECPVTGDMEIFAHACAAKTVVDPLVDNGWKLA